MGEFTKPPGGGRKESGGDVARVVGNPTRVYAKEIHAKPRL